MIPFRYDRQIPTLASGLAVMAGQSRNPRMWNAHLGTLYPEYMTYPGLNPTMIGMGNYEAIKIGALTIPRGRHGLYIDDHGSGGNYVRFQTNAGVASKMKLTPPFTLNVLYNWPSSQAGDSKVFIFTTDEKTAIGNYSGLMVWIDAGNIWVATADNTSGLFNLAGTAWSSGSSTLSQLDVWVHLVLVVKAVGTDIYGWANDGPLLFTPTAGQTQVNVSARHANCGWQRNDGTFTTGYLDLALWQCWNRALTEGECTLLKNDPWAMLRPARRVMGKAPAGRIVSLGGQYRHDGRIVLTG